MRTDRGWRSSSPPTRSVSTIARTLACACSSPHSARRQCSAVVVELHRDVEVGALQQLLHRLQVVPLLAADPQLVALDLGLHALGALVADELGDLLRDVGLDALLDAGGDLVDLAGGLRL